MWMHVSSLPTNSSLQDTPRYQFTLKSETIDNLTILLTAILKMVASLNDPEWKFQHYKPIPYFKILLEIREH
jgi:hypothetical protein